LIGERNADRVSGAPEDAAGANAALTMGEPQRELIGHSFSLNHDDLRAAIREIGQSTGARHLAVAD
jgi:hypothetical protein